MHKAILKFAVISSSILIYNIAQAEQTQTKAASPIYFELGSGVAFNSGKETDTLTISSNDKKFKNKTSIPLSGSIGYRYSPNFRWDINITYLPEWNVHLSGRNSYGNKADLKTSINSLSNSINGYYDFTNFAISEITPYVTAGVGFSINKIAETDYYVNDTFVAKYSGSSTNNPLWKVGLGATHKINDSLFIDLSYRFVSLGKVKSKPGYEVNHTLDDDEDVNTNVSFPYSRDTISFKNLYSQQIMLSVGFNF